MGEEKQLATDVLRGVSRSFYVSLRWLPRRMRDPVSLAYLLARAADTLADTAGVPVATRLGLLDQFRSVVEGGGGAEAFGVRVAREFVPLQDDPAERRLFEGIDSCFGWLRRLGGAEAEAVREVVATITGGQRLDLERFGEATSGAPRCLADGAELEDYAWRVAGCVGVFWTRVGVLADGAGFARRPVAEMERLGAAYGKGLQLVNILRDLPGDLTAGRCYLPVGDPFDREELGREWRLWSARARAWLGDGIEYGVAVRGWRVRVATLLPARLGLDTLDLLERGPLPPAGHVKLPRKRVWLGLLRSMAGGGAGQRC